MVKYIAKINPKISDYNNNVKIAVFKKVHIKRIIVDVVTYDDTVENLK